MTAACPLCEVVARCERGEFPLRIALLDHTAVILGDNQGCPGWCVAVLRRHVEHLDELPVDEQAGVFAEVAAVARAIRAEFPRSGANGSPPRINYECLGNVVAHIHWHVIPRHAVDPTPRAPVWGWSPEQLRGPMPDAERAALAQRLVQRLRK